MTKMQNNKTLNRRKWVAASAAVVMSFGLAAPAVAYAEPPTEPPAVDRSVWQDARAELRAALMAAHQEFRAAARAAMDQLKTDTAEEREALKAVLTNPESTPDQRFAAKQQFRTDTADERATFRSAMQQAVADHRAARKAAWEAFRAAVGGEVAPPAAG